MCEEFLFSLISVVSLKKYELTVSISLSANYFDNELIILCKYSKHPRLTLLFFPPYLIVN